MDTEAPRPRLCAHRDDAPPEADVVLHLGEVTVGAHASVLAERSAYFAALLAWPRTAESRATPLPSAPEATADRDADRWVAPGPGDARSLRVVELHDVDPDAAMLALRALYGLPWAARWDEIVAAHELLDAWNTPPDTCAALRRRLGFADPYDRDVYPDACWETLLALAWGVDPRPLSDGVRFTLVEVAVRRPESFGSEAWKRAGGAVAARFLAHPNLKVCEDVVLEAALGWARAAPRTDAELAAVSVAVRYGVLGEAGLARLCAEPDVPTAMVADAGRLMLQRARCAFAADLPVTGDVIARFLPRTSVMPPRFASRAVSGRWFFWHTSCASAGHRACYGLPLTYLHDSVRQYGASSVCGRFELKPKGYATVTVVFTTDGTSYKAKIHIRDVQQAFRIRVDPLCTVWQMDVRVGQVYEDEPVFWVRDIVSHACTVNCVLREKHSFPVLMMHVIVPDATVDGQ